MLETVGPADCLTLGLTLSYKHFHFLLCPETQITAAMERPVPQHTVCSLHLIGVKGTTFFFTQAKKKVNYNVWQNHTWEH